MMRCLFTVGTLILVLEFPEEAKSFHYDRSICTQKSRLATRCKIIGGYVEEIPSPRPCTLCTYTHILTPASPGYVPTYPHTSFLGPRFLSACTGRFNRSEECGSQKDPEASRFPAGSGIQALLRLVEDVNRGSGLEYGVGF